MESFSKLGIDLNSLLIYLVNFGLLWFVLAKLVLPKIIKTMDDRRNQIANNLTTASTLEKELEELVARSRANEEQLIAELRSERKTLESENTERRAHIIAEANQEKNRILEEARNQIEAERLKLITSSKLQIIKIIGSVLKETLGTEVPEAKVVASVEKSWKVLIQKPPV